MVLAKYAFQKLQRTCQIRSPPEGLMVKIAFDLFALMGALLQRCTCFRMSPRSLLHVLVVLLLGVAPTPCLLWPEMDLYVGSSARISSSVGQDHCGEALRFLVFFSASMVCLISASILLSSLWSVLRTDSGLSGGASSFHFFFLLRDR